jgi:hypothetical protein
VAHSNAKLIWFTRVLAGVLVRAPAVFVHPRSSENTISRASVNFEPRRSWTRGKQRSTKHEPSTLCKESLSRRPPHKERGLEADLGARGAPVA